MAGPGFLGGSLAGWICERFAPQPAPRMFPEVPMRNCTRMVVHRAQPLLTGLPNFGLLCGAVLLFVAFCFMILQPLTPRGLYIHLPNHRAALPQASPWQGTLSVYLGTGERFYVNGREVPKDGLGTKLQQELRSRVEWTVYFEADYDTLNGNAIYAMDTIQGLGAKLVWITPQVRKELEEQTLVQRKLATQSQSSIDR
jgi:biopolymer transport protein ExbD